jgi:cyanobactin cluster PatC/TenC/TruC protein
MASKKNSKSSAKASPDSPTSSPKSAEAKPAEAKSAATKPTATKSAADLSAKPSTPQNSEAGETKRKRTLDTGLADYGKWLKDSKRVYKERDEEAEEVPFRRGLIWS